MPENLKIAFIGGGNMGEAMLAAILEQGLARHEEIRVSDIAESRRFALRQKYGVVTGNNTEVVMGRDVIILAVKPKDAASVALDLAGKLRPDQLVLSIAAGVTVNNLCSGLDHRRVVRVMPNTPAQIGEGISVWTAAPEVTPRQREWTVAVLRTLGKELYVAEEKYIDMATAISGSGPAYFFYFMEALMHAGVEIGLPPEMARELVYRTALGAARYAEKSGKPLDVLRQMVTSPGGTTAAALSHLEEANFSEIVRKAVIAAYERAKTLGM